MAIYEANSIACDIPWLICKLYTMWEPFLFLWLGLGSVLGDKRLRTALGSPLGKAVF